MLPFFTLFEFELSDEDNELRTGKHFDNFFTNVTAGKFGKSEVPYQPVLDNAHAGAFDKAFASHAGHFGDHIAKSIPTFRDVQVRKGHAIVAAFGGRPGTLLDIGGGEGAFAKSITQMSRGLIRTRVLETNPAMQSHFHSHTRVPGVEFDARAFHQGWREDDGREIQALHADNSETRFDIIHESMVFQFISPDRGTHFAQVKRLLNPGGLFITEEKVRTPETVWNHNEKFKDNNHKNRYFSATELADKDKVVGFQQDKGDAKTVGMVANMAEHDALEQILMGLFRYVYQYWDAGNFKGYAASDDRQRASAFLQAVGDTTSPYSTVKLPRKIGA